MSTQFRTTEVDELILGDCAKLVPTYIYRGVLRHGDCFEFIYIDQDCMRSILFKPDKSPYYSYNLLNNSEDSLTSASVNKIAAAVSHSLILTKLVFLMEKLPTKLTYDLFIKIAVYDHKFTFGKLISEYSNTPIKTANEFKNYFIDVHTCTTNSTVSQQLIAPALKETVTNI